MKKLVGSLLALLLVAGMASAQCGVGVRSIGIGHRGFGFNRVGFNSLGYGGFNSFGYGGVGLGYGGVGLGYGGCGYNNAAIVATVPVFTQAFVPTTTVVQASAPVQTTAPVQTSALVGESYTQAAGYGQSVAIVSQPICAAAVTPLFAGAYASPVFATATPFLFGHNRFFGNHFFGGHHGFRGGVAIGGVRGVTRIR